MSHETTFREDLQLVHRTLQAQRAKRRRMRDRPSDEFLAAVSRLMIHVGGPLRYEYEHTRTGEVMMLPSSDWRLVRVHLVE